MKTRIAIHGACGRMGQRLVALACEDPSLQVVAAIDSPSHPKMGSDAGELAGVGTIGVKVTPGLEVSADALIDFSTPSGTMSILPTCTARALPLIVATTGHTAEQVQEIEAAAHQTALIYSANLSLVVNILFKLVGDTARILSGRGFDVEIIEWHHRFKKDSPSGTATTFAKIIQQSMGQTEVRHGREGIIGERPSQEIGVHAIRAGDNVGEHTIIFSTLGETLELIHRGSSRDSYVFGALQAAKYLSSKGAGRYTMNDVLGIN